MSKELLINKILTHLGERIDKGELSNDDMVQLIEFAGQFLNLKTIPDYAKDNNLSYNGVKKHREIKIIFNVQFVIGNE